MTPRPTSEELHQLISFLRACERAANPPPAPSHVLRRPLHPAPPKLGPHPETLVDLIRWGPAPFEATERLGDERAGRVAQLYLWLRRFPVFAWLKEQPELTMAFESFTRIRKKRKYDPKFTDDLADIRFWLFACCAEIGIAVKNKPPPRADERTQAAAAAKTLRDIANRTTLFRAAGIRYPDTDNFCRALDQLQTLTTIERRPRTDKSTNDRKYVELLTEAAIWIFDDAPPALIYEVAALKVRDPDKVSITKQVSALKKLRAAKV